MKSILRLQRLVSAPYPSGAAFAGQPYSTFIHGLFNGLPGKAGMFAKDVYRGLSDLGLVDFEMAFETAAKVLDAYPLVSHAHR